MELLGLNNGSSPPSPLPDFISPHPRPAIPPPIDPSATFFAPRSLCLFPLPDGAVSSLPGQRTIACW